LFGMAIYTEVKYPNFSTGCSDNTSKATTKTVPKTVRNGLMSNQKMSETKKGDRGTRRFVPLFLRKYRGTGFKNCQLNDYKLFLQAF